MKRALLSSLLLTMGLTAAVPAAAGPIRDMMRDFVLRREAVRDKAAVASLQLPAGATVSRDVAYGPDPAQRLDVYRPAGAKKAPIIVMVHGGAWSIGDKVSEGVVENKIAYWLPRGYVFVSVDYPLVPKADPLQQAKDVGRATAFVKAHAAGWGGDPSRLVLMGHSAGAHLVALLAADADLARSSGAGSWLGTIALDSAAYDVPAIMARPHYRFYDEAFGKDPAFWRRTSPVDRIAGTPSPMLLVCSTKREDSCPPARRFQDALKSHGTHVGVLQVALTHAQINQDLGLSGDYTQKVQGFMRGLGLP